jgi:hypothetical protein
MRREGTISGRDFLELHRPAEMIKEPYALAEEVGREMNQDLIAESGAGGIAWSLRVDGDARDSHRGVSSPAYSLRLVTIVRRTCAGFVKRKDS